MNPLALVPLKDWLYIGAIAVLLAGFGVFVHHERAIGAQRIEALDAKLAAAQTARNQALEAKANAELKPSIQQYKLVVAAPPASDAPHILCYEPSAGGAVSGHAGAGPVDHAAAGVPGAHTEDPGPAIDKQAEDADAQVRALQAYIKACIGAGLCRAFYR